MIASICWAIWRSSNDTVWNKKRSQVNKIFAWTKQYLVEWICAQDHSTDALSLSLYEGDGARTWVRPQANKRL